MEGEETPGNPSCSPAELAAKRLFEQAEPVRRELAGPSSGLSKSLLKACGADHRYEPALAIAIGAGYATRLEQRDESAARLLPPAPNPKAALVAVIRSELVHGEDFFASVFPLGEPIWDALLELWIEDVGFWALADGNAPLPSRAAIEEAIKLGCVAAIVDQSYGLSPRRITDPPPLYQQIVAAIVAPLLFFFHVVPPRLVASLLASFNLAGNQPAQSVAITMTAAVALAEIAQIALRVKDIGSGLNIPLLLVSKACGWAGICLLIYSFF